MTNYVIDTNIMTALLRQEQSVMNRFDAVAVPANTFLLCPMVWYELRRGLLARNADKQLGLFETLSATFKWQDYTPPDWSLAVSLWAQRRQQGRPVDDADLLIAVFTFNRQAVLVTANEKDFVGLGLTIENWAKAT